MTWSHRNRPRVQNKDIQDANQGGLVSLILLEANQGIRMQQSQELMAREDNCLAAFHIDDDYCIETEKKT